MSIEAASLNTDFWLGIPLSFYFFFYVLCWPFQSYLLFLTLSNDSLETANNSLDDVFHYTFKLVKRNNIMNWDKKFSLNIHSFFLKPMY